MTKFLKSIFHLHTWKNPEVPDGLILRDQWMWLINGQVCKCGARRQYRGPMYGWKRIN